jgi:Arc/MetJ-type ribon-helix-helix transcriptional regulator
MGKSEHVSVRLSKEQIKRIDALIGDVSSWWRTATRSDVIRILVLEGLERAERGESLMLEPVKPYCSANKPNRRRVK